MLFLNVSMFFYQIRHDDCPCPCPCGRTFLETRPGGVCPSPHLVLLSFFYGVLHAAGPGHGKAVATSYLFSRGRQLGNGLLLGNLIALFHALSAVVLVVILREILSVSITGSLDKTMLLMQKISYALIAMMGTGLLVQNLINWRRRKHQENTSQTLPMALSWLHFWACFCLPPSEPVHLTFKICLNSLPPRFL